MKRILLIEDDELVRTMLRKTLERAGYEVAEAPDGRKGIALQNEKPADLIITDILMPDQEGLETIIEVTRTFPKMKMIAISGGGRVDSEYYLRMAKQFGAIQTFTKPIDREKLLAAVQELLK